VLRKGIAIGPQKATGLRSGPFGEVTPAPENLFFQKQWPVGHRHINNPSELMFFTAWSGQRIVSL
jgi:hypothetical protein